MVGMVIGIEVALARRRQVLGLASNAEFEIPEAYRKTKFPLMTGFQQLHGLGTSVTQRSPQSIYRDRFSCRQRHIPIIPTPTTCSLPDTDFRLGCAPQL